MRRFHFFYLVLFLLQLNGISAVTPVAYRGILDLRNEKFHEIQAVTLNGQWEFYWQDFIFPEDFNKKLIPDTYFAVPAYWISYKNDIPKITKLGYGTYHLKILMPPKSRDTLSLKIPVFDSSYELYLNNLKVASNGRTGTTSETSVPYYKPIIYDFINQNDTLDITIHVSNFHHLRGGFWKPLQLGEKSYIFNKNEKSKFIDSALGGVLFVIFLIFCGFFLLERTNVAFLYFSITTFGVLLRLINTGFFPGNYFMSQHWVWTIRLEYIGSFITLAFGALYLGEIIPSQRIKKLKSANLILAIISVLFIISTKPTLFAYTNYHAQILGIAFLLYFIVKSFTLMLKKNKQQAIIFFSLALFLFALINDSLVSFSVSPFNFGYILPLAFIVFIIIQSSVVITNWTQNFREKIKLHNELQHINANLETIIENRTDELNKTNAELKAALDVKSRMYSIIAHDLKSPISTLAQYSDLLVTKYRQKEDQAFLTEFQRLAYSSIYLIDNLLHWGLKQETRIQYKPEIFLIRETGNDIFPLFKNSLEQKNLSFHFEIPDNLTVFCDVALLKITLRNLINNAIKFTPKNGTITLSAVREHDFVRISVRDNGIGIEESIINNILNSKTASGIGTEGEKGTGLGMIVVKDLVEINKGTLLIESKPGKGTVASFTLPGKP